MREFKVGSIVEFNNSALKLIKSPTSDKSWRKYEGTTCVGHVVDEQRDHLVLVKWDGIVEPRPVAYTWLRRLNGLEHIKRRHSL